MNIRWIMKEDKTNKDIDLYIKGNNFNIFFSITI